MARVARAASRDESRPVLTGVLVRFEGNELVMAATDSYRMSVKHTELTVPAGAAGERLDRFLAEHVGSRLHVCHLSTAGSVDIIRWAKKRGVNVTAEVTPHHLLLTEELVRGYDATLVSDAHTTEDLSPWGAPPPELVIAHTNLYWGKHEAPGRTAGTVEAKDVDFAA